MPLPSARFFFAILIGCVAGRCVSAAAPSFELVPLGVFGGEVESNSSCFLLRHPGHPAPSLLLDCGSPVSGILRWKRLDSASVPWKLRMDAVTRELANVPAIFLTHSHLDHLYGFVLQSPLHLDGRLAGSTTEVWGNPNTVRTLRDSIFNGRVWGDFTRARARGHPAFVLRTLEDGKPVAAAGFAVESVPLVHPATCSAMLVTAPDGSAYLHLGDTGPSEAVWRRARPLLLAGKLRAVGVETSFASRQRDLAGRTGHLTPATLVRELGKLAALPPPASWGAAGPTFGQALAAAPRIGKALAGVEILIHHIKPSSFDDVAAELGRLAAAGLPVRMLEQGKPLTF